jgi:hypothetical protein
MAAIQEHGVEAVLERTNGNRVHLYRGVRLNERAQKFVDQQVKFEEDVF